MRFRLLAAVVAIALPAQHALVAQQKLTLAEAEKLALRHNPQISSAQFSAAAAHQTPKEFHAGLEPLLTGSLTGVGADTGSRIGAGNITNSVLYNRIGSGVAISQLVTDFGRTGNLIASANLRAQAQDQLTETARADVLMTTARAYFAVLRANAVLKVAQQTVAEREIVRDKVDALYKNELKSKLDASFASVRLAEAKLFLSQAESDVHAAEAALASAIGAPTQGGFQLAEEPMPAPLPDSAEPLIRQALQDRPELKDLRLEQSAAERFTRAEKALRYPTISAAGVTGIVPAGQAQVQPRYGAAGVNVSIPILDGGLYGARRTEAELKAKAAAERVAAQANLITRDVRTAYLNAATAGERVGLTEQLLAQAQLSLDLAQGRYDLGLSSIVELSEAQLSLTSAQISNAAARYEYQAQRLFVDYQVGALR